MQSIIPLVCKKLGISWVVFSDLIWRDANIPRWIRKTFCYRQYLSIYTWYQLIQVHNRMKAHILRQCKEALVGWLSTFHFCALEQVCKFNQNMWKTIFNYNRLKYSPFAAKTKNREQSKYSFSNALATLSLFIVFDWLRKRNFNMFSSVCINTSLN